MKLLFIRHGDPDYSIDSLTEKGWREAKLLSERVSKWDNITDIYCSPLGRAKDTASFSLDRLGRNSIEKEWLKEFYYPVFHPEFNREHVPWDFLPDIWTKMDIAFDKDNWYKAPVYDNQEIKPKYDEVVSGIDDILAEHGFVREGNLYIDKSGESDNEQVLVFFCHLGVICVMLSHILNVSPSTLWHNFYLAPTSVTIVGSEERQIPFASFRVQTWGDTRHLSDGLEPVSSAGYFTKSFQG